MDLTEDEQENKLRNIKEKTKVNKSNRNSIKLAKINYNYGSQNFRQKGPKISVRNSQQRTESLQRSSIESTERHNISTVIT